MRAAFLLALVTLAFAQKSYFTPISTTTITTCRKGTKLVDLSASYLPNATVAKQACAAEYEEACPTPRGVVLCNLHEAVCRDSDRKIDADINPAYSIYATSAKPRECVSAGLYFHPEAVIIAPVQCTVSFVVIVIASIVGFIGFRGRVSIFVLAAYWSIIVTSILLLVSFYYLNAFIGTMVAIITVSTYATKNENVVPIGMLAATLALLWFTFDGGLGYYQHHARLELPDLARDPAKPFYETLCNNYYRFAFDVPQEIIADDINPAFEGWGICDRAWLATVYFFVILLKLLLAFLVAAGGASLF